MEKIKKALKKNLEISIPFLDEIVNHIFVSNQNFSRSSFLLQCASIFRNPDDQIIDIGTTLEYLYTATSLHDHINDFENSRRQMKHVKNFLSSEASILIGDYLLSKSFKILTKLGNLDVLECVSLATKNISRGQVMEVSEPALYAKPNHWHKVTKYKISGLYGAGAKSAAYWGNASQETASRLFTFGEHFGTAIQIKNELKNIYDKKIIYQKLCEKDLWYPLSYLMHNCLNNRERIEIVEKLKNDFDVTEMSKNIFNLFKKFDLGVKLREAACKELKKAEEVLYKLEIDTKKILPLTKFTNI